MYEITEFLVTGILLGFAAGISPGPLMAITISESLQHGSKEGFKVAISPLITDFLIVSAVIYILMHFQQQNSVIALISLAGALYLMQLGIASLRTKNISIEITNQKKESLKKGILANFLNPHPYLFWIAIGGPILFRASEVDRLAQIMFVIGFYVLLVGSKVVIALFVGKSKDFLKSKYYLHLFRSLGILYLIFALVFIEQGLELLGLHV
ncbi:Lysine exporter protein (LYSE/YGGA) [Methanohalophilus mahii DSM 5219]|uniref:Lysine exporter protein (LYSE/YGGA) n=2 Tax=Methanohalophilus mahii TaxID=2176 RepID=D5E8T7_METMS|nr:Lysine exporter protein (LYSE/YGGA) [Methanohalophilus mahii DSM 5219]